MNLRLSVGIGRIFLSFPPSEPYVQLSSHTAQAVCKIINFWFVCVIYKTQKSYISVSEKDTFVNSSVIPNTSHLPLRRFCVRITYLFTLHTLHFSENLSVWCEMSLTFITKSSVTSWQKCFQNTVLSVHTSLYTHTLHTLFTKFESVYC